MAEDEMYQDYLRNRFGLSQNNIRDAYPNLEPELVMHHYDCHAEGFDDGGCWCEPWLGEVWASCQQDAWQIARQQWGDQVVKIRETRPLQR